MALPPITTSSLIGKVLGTDSVRENKDRAQTTEDSRSAQTSTPRDVVEISDAAQAKLKEAESLNEAQARATAADTRDQLAEDESLTLGRNG